MIAEEALKELQGKVIAYPTEKSEEALELALVALEKQIPKGVPMASEPNRAGYTDTFICPSCGAHIQMPYSQREYEYDYCPYCGQRLE